MDRLSKFLSNVEKLGGPGDEATLLGTESKFCISCQPILSFAVYVRCMSSSLLIIMHNTNSKKEVLTRSTCIGPVSWRNVMTASTQEIQTANDAHCS